MGIVYILGQVDVGEARQGSTLLEIRYTEGLMKEISDESKRPAKDSY